MNKHRSKTFIKIKHSIQSAVTKGHLDSCRQMIDNASVVCDKEELGLLVEFHRTAERVISPLLQNTNGE